MHKTGGRLGKTGAILIVGIAVVALLAVWGGEARSASTPQKSSAGLTSSATCSSAPVRGGNLVYERQAATETLDPLNPLNGNGDIFSYNLIYSGLVRSDPTGKTNNIVPSLSDHWTISSNGKTYTFHLRPGIKFSNGQPVTAEDVAWTLNRFGNPKINGVMAAVAVGFGHATVVNGSTVRVQLKRPVAAFLYDISIWPAFILPKNLVQKEGKAFYTHPVGSGPFAVKSFVKGSNITFTRNPYYWESGKPYLDSVRFNFVTDSNTRILALRAGNAQEMDVVPFSQVKSLESNKNIVVQTAKVPLFLGLWLNHLRAQFTDINVRKAMQYAIDRALINQQIFTGLGTIPNSVLMGFALDAPASVVKPYTYDLTKAKALMAQSKYPKGFSTTLLYPAGTDFYNQLTLALQQEFGVDLELLMALAERGDVVRVGPDGVFLPDAVERFGSAIIAALATGPITVARARDLTGSSRKHVVPLLQFLDDHGLTRRVGDDRILIHDQATSHEQLQRAIHRLRDR
jgi:peptide/nickel transport system substrate-binding protein